MSLLPKHPDPLKKPFGPADAGELASATGSEAALIHGIWVMIKEIENPHPETAEYIPRINVASKLRTLLMAAGYEWQKPPNAELSERRAKDYEKHK